MMTIPLHPLAEDYLARLDASAQGLPSHERLELVAELRSHLADGLPASATDADVRNLLQELGPPEAIVTAAYVESRGSGVSEPVASSWCGPAPGSPWGAVEILAVLGLTLGAFLLPVVGPLAGILLVWVSTRWTRPQKLVATALAFLPVVVLTVVSLGLLATSGPQEGTTVPVQPAPGVGTGVGR